MRGALGLAVAAALGCIGLAFWHALRSPVVQAGGWLVQGLLVLALLAISCVTLGDKLVAAGINPLLPMAGTLLLVLLLLVSVTIRGWWLAKAAGR